MKRNILTAALLTTALLAAPAFADDAWDQQVKEEIAYFKKYAKKAKDPQKWGDLVLGIADTNHPAAAKELGKLLMKDKNVDHQMILAEALSGMKRKEEGRLAAGEALLNALDKGKKFEVDVIDSIANSLGKLKYKPSVFSLCELLKKGGDPYLLVTVVRAVGNLEDLRALPTLLELWERHPVGYSWETGEVTVEAPSPAIAS